MHIIRRTVTRRITILIVANFVFVMTWWQKESTNPLSSPCLSAMMSALCRSLSNRIYEYSDFISYHTYATRGAWGLRSHIQQGAFASMSSVRQYHTEKLFVLLYRDLIPQEAGPYVCIDISFEYVIIRIRTVLYSPYHCPTYERQRQYNSSIAAASIIPVHTYIVSVSSIGYCR